MSSSRRVILSRIMEIEEEIKDIYIDADFRKIKRNIDILGASKTGSRSIRVRSPSDMTKVIEVRRHSEDSKNVMKAYQLKLYKYTSRINELSREKSGLKKQLFT